MLKQNAFSSCAGTMAILVLGTAFSTTLFAAESAGDAAAPGNAPAEAFANAARAYPPSCLVDGLPLGKSNLDANAKTVPITLQLYDTTTGGYGSEADSVTIWRVPCSGGAAATLIEIDRPAASNGNTAQYPIFPDIYITSAATGTTRIYPRLAPEPNTRFADRSLQFSQDGFTFFYSNTVNVFEHFDPANVRSNPAADYNQAFTLNLDNLVGGGLPLVINVPAYVPPTTPAAMEISGYMSTNWSSQTEGAEGIVLQVYDNGDKATRTLAFAWFTYNDSGLPFWLYGQASLNIGDTSVTAQTVYFKGGTFAGTSGAGAQQPWGSVTFTFPDCGHMNIAYNGDASADHGPKGNSTAVFTRVADVNGLVCQ
jgi:hypothetical protein